MLALLVVTVLLGFGQAKRASEITEEWLSANADLLDSELDSHRYIDIQPIVFMRMMILFRWAVINLCHTNMLVYLQDMFNNVMFDWPIACLIELALSWDTITAVWIGCLA